MKKYIFLLFLFCNFYMPTFAITHSLYDAFGYEVGHLSVINDRYEIYAKNNTQINSYKELLKYVPKVRKQFLIEYGVFSETGRKIHSFSN